MSFIDCTFMVNTRPGIPAKDVLQKGIEAYKAKGFPEEWKLHHQGGSIVTQQGLQDEL